MLPNLIIRKALPSDIDFIIEAIIESAKSGTETNLFCTLFSVSLSELKDILRNILLEDIPGQDLFLSGFLIAEVDKIKAGACCSWIEGEAGKSSAFIRGTIFLYFIGQEKLSKAQKHFELIEGLHFEREFGTIQIESVYVRSEFRGMQLSKSMIDRHIQNYLENGKSVKKVQIILAKTNDFALRSYNKIGFQLVAEKSTEDDLVLELIPSKTILLMEKLL